ncbi:hypothetical protein R3P38DRAFT_2881360 [Favolaschia claudopus]|uniref:Uncharacterized protein n=1 Tax=Favolaschia claudopus TaxID=2862362 RepID=A0AAW0D1Q8_9AGAR
MSVSCRFPTATLIVSTFSLIIAADCQGNVNWTTLDHFKIGEAREAHYVECKSVDDTLDSKNIPPVDCTTTSLPL